MSDGRHTFCVALKFVMFLECPFFTSVFFVVQCLFFVCSRFKIDLNFDFHLNTRFFVALVIGQLTHYRLSSIHSLQQLAHQWFYSWWTETFSLSLLQHSVWMRNMLCPFRCSDVCCVLGSSSVCRFCLVRMDSKSTLHSGKSFIFASLAMGIYLWNRQNGKYNSINAIQWFLTNNKKNCLSVDEKKKWMWGKT